MGDERPRDTGPARPRRWIPRAFAIVIAGACVWDLATRSLNRRPAMAPSHAVDSIPSSPYRNTAPGVAYVGDEVCARCHAEIARPYRAHPMGRSMSTPAGSNLKAEGVVFQVGDLVYSILKRGEDVLHREEKRDRKGHTTITSEGVVRYVLGSGRRGLAFLVEKEDGLYQSPITWYSQARRWALSPHYDIQNLHFDRRILDGCLYCHAGRFERAKGRPPVFHSLAVGCERCHGPGELHARRPEVAEGRDWTIVNPAVLEPRPLRESVCEQCHLQGSGRMDQPGRSAFDYRPGLPFEAFVQVLYPKGGPRKRHQAVGHVREMHESRCYQQSGGELGCLSCHDPHRLPAPRERTAYYRGRCLECHAGRGCALPRDRRVAQQPDDDCTACHMPRLDTIDIAHTAITLHTVPRNNPVKP